jgi:hypothetical protein
MRSEIAAVGLSLTMIRVGGTIWLDVQPNET